MDMFIVAYQAFDGEMEVFGIFDSFEDAYKWMKTDFERNLMMFEREKIKKNSTINEDSMIIDEYGEWKIYKVNQASPIF